MDIRGLWLKATQSTPGLADKRKATPRERRVGRLHSLQEEKPNTQVQGGDAVSMRKGIEGRQKKDWWTERHREESLGVDTENSRYSSS